jgi:carboxymethylenebutenolidase
MNSSWIDVAAADQGSFKAYLSLPPTGKGPGILLIQEIFGVNEHMRDIADQYALDGYCVIAPDVFWRQQPRVDMGYGEDDMARGFALMKRLDFSLVMQDLTATVNTLRTLPSCTGKVSSLGYCMGGLLSYLSAVNAGVDAAVCYYPGGIADQLSLADKIRCPVIIHFAGDDQFIPAPTIAAAQKTFEGRTNASVHVYPEVHHGFNCWARPSYNQHAASLAHGRSLIFLSGSL